MIKEGQLLITFYEHTSPQAKSEIHMQLGGKKIDEISQLHLEIIEVPVGEEEKF
ncbi:S8 family serine peptidase, partial [Bacillus toyonensis]|uniref:S8 family serine peptidase n=1 Tax=Bacillus toyonensis TaxID=155322 RepID=UPI0015CF1E47